jgi:hypothetical protein
MLQQDPAAAVPPAAAAARDEDEDALVALMEVLEPAKYQSDSVARASMLLVRLMEDGVSDDAMQVCVWRVSDGLTQA